MLDLFIGLKRVIKRRMVHIDNSVFRLHWLFTSILLISCSLIVTSRQYVGDPIDCLQTDNIPASVLNTYCWIHSTYTVPAAFDKIVGIEVAHPGIETARERNYEDALEEESNLHDASKQKAKAKLNPAAIERAIAAKPKAAHNRNLFRSSKHRKYYTYYQWVCFALFIQAMLFYLPYYIWKLWEGGLLQAITLGMQLAMLSDEERGRKRNILNDYLYTHLRHHKMYAYKYFFCEFLCFLNVFGQFFLMNWFFEGEFLEYGFKVIRYAKHDQSLTYDPMTYIFPRMTKCTFHSYGSSGDVQRHDALCMLTLNVVNEKIYILIWFWFAALFFLLMFVLLYRMLILFAWKWRSYFLVKRCTLSYFGDLNYICENGNIGDWFLLYMLGSNLDPLLMREVTEEMAARMRKDDQLFQEKVLRERKGQMIEKNRTFNPLSGFRKKRPELTDCADEPRRKATRPTAPSLSNPYYCVDPPAIYPAPEYTSGGYLPNAHCCPGERYTANCTDNCPSNHFVTTNRAIRAEKTAHQPPHKSDRIHSSRSDARPSTAINHSHHQQSAIGQPAAGERSGCRQSCCNPQAIGEENDEDYLDDNQETIAANHCLKTVDDEIEYMDRHCALRHSSTSIQSINKELISRQEAVEMQAGRQSTVASNQRRCITRTVNHCSNSCSNSGKLSNARQLSNASNSTNASNLTNSTAQSTGHASSLHPSDSRRTSCYRHSARRPLPASSTANCANDCCLPASQEHSEVCSLASSDVDYECKLDSECSGNELNQLIKREHSQSSLPNRTSGYQSNVFSNNSNNSDTLDQVSSLEQTSLDKASLEKASLGRSSLNKALRNESPVDRAIVDMSAVDRSLADRSLVVRSVVDKSAVDRSLTERSLVSERSAGDRTRSSQPNSLNSGQPLSNKPLLLTSSRRRLFGDALSTLIPFNRTRSERGSAASPTSTSGSSKVGKGNKSSNKVNAGRTDLSSSTDGRHFDALKASGPNCNRPESQPNAKKSKHRKAKRTDSENVHDHLASSHNVCTEAAGRDSRPDSPSVDGHRNAGRLFQIKKYLKSKPKRHSTISHHFTSNQPHTIENDDDAHSAAGYLRQPSDSMMHHLTDQLGGLPALKSAEPAKKQRNSLDK